MMKNNLHWTRNLLWFFFVFHQRSQLRLVGCFDTASKVKGNFDNAFGEPFDMHQSPLHPAEIRVKSIFVCLEGHHERASKAAIATWGTLSKVLLPKTPCQRLSPNAFSCSVRSRSMTKLENVPVMALSQSEIGHDTLFKWAQKIFGGLCPCDIPS